MMHVIQVQASGQSQAAVIAFCEAWGVVALCISTASTCGGVEQLTGRGSSVVRSTASKLRLVGLTGLAAPAVQPRKHQSR